MPRERRIAAPKTRSAQVRKLVARGKDGMSPTTRATADDREAWRDAKRAAAAREAEGERAHLRGQLAEAARASQLKEEARRREVEARREARVADIEEKRAAREHAVEEAAAARQELARAYRAGMETLQEKQRGYRATLRDVPRIPRPLTAGKAARGALPAADE